MLSDVSDPDEWKVFFPDSPTLLNIFFKHSNLMIGLKKEDPSPTDWSSFVWLQMEE